jgi:hypothetical protein
MIDWGSAMGLDSSGMDYPWMVVLVDLSFPNHIILVFKIHPADLALQIKRVRELSI